MPKIDKSRIQDLVGLHRGGLSVKEILESNPDVKKSSLYYHIKKSKNQEAPQEPQEPQEPVVQVQEQEPVVQESRPKPVVIEKKAPVIDSFLADFRPDAFKKESGPSKRGLLDDFFPDHQKATSKLDYSPEFLSRPAEPSKKPESTIKGKTIDGHGKSWWLSVSKKKAPAKTPEQQQDDKQMETVQKLAST